MNFKKLLKNITPPLVYFGLKKIISPLINHSQGLSHSYQIIDQPDIGKLRQRYAMTWQDSSIPKKQLEITSRQLTGFDPTSPMAIACQLVKSTNLNQPSLLDVGCSTGYYYEVFRNSDIRLDYQGCDYSANFIKHARQLYPQAEFKICDALSLDYPNQQFDIVFSGGCLLHIIDYEQAIAETARVAKSWVIFHRTPIIHQRSTTFCKKIGYDLEMLEIIFNEREFVSLLTKCGLAINQIITGGAYQIPRIDEPVFTKYYLTKKL